MKKKILYYQKLLLRNDDELTKKIVKAQEQNPVKGDFVSSVQSDMSYLSLSKLDISIRSEDSLKSHLELRIEEVAFHDLMSVAKTHSKTNANCYKDLKGCSYFFDSNFSPDICNLLFMFRTRMFNVKGNFRNKYKSDDAFCPIKGCNEIETQDHIMSCEPVIHIFGNNLECEYKDIFSDKIDELLKVGTTLLKLVEIRQSLIESENEDGATI